AKPNAAHLALVELEQKYSVQIITQNIDDLHERAGSKNVLHLHGEIMKMRSSAHQDLIYEMKETEIKLGDKCEKGSQLRPHIVWFGEAVPKMEKAIELTMQADIFIVIGTSLEVYPAASLLEYAPENITKYLVDPNAKSLPHISNLTTVKQSAGDGVPLLVNKLNTNPS
ncbi:MAG: NAD-dependent deacylase, partial [Bacteroidia bacterium]|nr:NAD-dependent deacylase [Bacteroidia bacterium]